MICIFVKTLGSSGAKNVKHLIGTPGRIGNSLSDLLKNPRITFAGIGESNPLLNRIKGVDALPNKNGVQNRFNQVMGEGSILDDVSRLKLSNKIDGLSQLTADSKRIFRDIIASNSSTPEQLRSVESLAKRLNEAPKAGLSDESVKFITDIKPNPSKGIFRPSPSEYLAKEFIESHLKQFDGGVVKITSYSPNKEFNSGLLGSAREGSQEFTTFVMPKNLVKDMISAANGNSDILEDLLGFSRGDLKGKIHILEIDKPSNLRIPSGNEGGAFEDFWQPGGKTWPGGIPEGVIDSPKWGDYHEISIDELLGGK